MASTQVSTGTQGNTVPQATTVTRGPQGVQGWQGTVGFQGAVGYQGVTGVQGYQGYQGVSTPSTPSLWVCSKCNKLSMKEWSTEKKRMTVRELSREEASALVLMEKVKPVSVDHCDLCPREERQGWWQTIRRLAGVE